MDPEPRRDLLSRAEHFAQRTLEKDTTGHDWWHVNRVRNLALRIARDEGADAIVVELAALLHDTDDAKFTGDELAGALAVNAWLERMHVEPRIIDEVTEIVRSISFRGALVADSSMTREGLCVRDADRLDAIGAIGIARSFAYGGYARRPLHNPSVAPVLHHSLEEYRQSASTTIGHFHEKLLLLQDRMSTEMGRALAKHRHDVVVAFLKEFELEWDGAL